MMKTSWISIIILMLLAACTNSNTTPSYVGDSSTQGYCGKPNEPYKVPITNDYDSSRYEKIEALESATYRATALSIYMREDVNREDSPEVLASHDPIFYGENFLTKSFYKNCARNVTTKESYSLEVVLPVEILFDGESLSWKTQKTASYFVEYGAEFNTILKLSAAMDDTASPSNLESDYVASLFLKNIETKKQNKNTQDMIYLQIQVSANPLVYARLAIQKLNPTEEESGTTDSGAITTNN